MKTFRYRCLLQRLFFGALIFATGLGFSTPVAFAVAEPEIHVDLNPPSAKVAQPIELRIEVTAPQGTQLTFPTFSSVLPSSAQVIETQNVADLPGEKADIRLWTSRTRFEHLVAGEFEIPEFQIQYELPDSELAEKSGNAPIQSVAVGPIQYSINSVLENEGNPAAFRDIKDAVEMRQPVPARSDGMVWIATGAVLLVGILTVAFLLIQKKQESPEQRALADLDRLESNRKSSITEKTNRFHEADFYSEVTDILREYAEARYGIQATTQTTPEFLRSLNDESLNNESLAKILTVADQVKFGGIDAGEIGESEVITWSRDFVQARN